jgi:hypothetical protein
MAAQWQALLKNLGEWQGSFTQFSPQGVFLQDTPSNLTLKLSENGKTVDLRLQRFPAGQPPSEIMLQFSYPGPGASIPFFETGAFSQGALQWSPGSQFGAEFSLIAENRRLRLVQLYAQGADFTNLTLIREIQAGSLATESQPLQVSALVGVWQGEAITLHPDGRCSDPFATHLQIQQNGDRLTQELNFENRTLRSTARIDTHLLHFEEGVQPMQLILLPGGASSLCPIKIQPKKPFVLEAGWLIAPHLRQRLTRTYNERGEWVNITLVTEHKTT